MRTIQSSATGPICVLNIRLKCTRFRPIAWLPVGEQSMTFASLESLPGSFRSGQQSNREVFRIFGNGHPRTSSQVLPTLRGVCSRSRWSNRMRFLVVLLSIQGSVNPQTCSGVAQDVAIGQKGRLDTLHIVPLIDVVPPPEPLEIVLELNSKRAVVERPLKTPIDLTAGENKPEPLAERHDLFHIL